MLALVGWDGRRRRWGRMAARRLWLLFRLPQTGLVLLSELGVGRGRGQEHRLDSLAAGLVTLDWRCVSNM